ncbi:MAG: DNA repair protein RecO [Gammaproteobacteria bacterium]|nr:DNA repair protein RecO [Gammaproteobacteria bacterium]
MILPPAKDQPAYVLHRRAFRETSVIVELLTRDHGRVAAVVRGVKGGGRPRMSIEPFTKIEVAWRGRGQMVTVIGSEAVQATYLTGDSLFAGLYVNELLIKTLQPQEPVESVFRHYGTTLTALAVDDLEPALRRFEKALLDELGYGLVFDVDVKTGLPIQAHKVYRAVDGEGFHETGNGAAEGEATLTGAEIAAIANGDFTDTRTRAAAKLVLRRALRQRLAGKRLNTRQLFARRPGQQANV